MINTGYAMTIQDKMYIVPANTQRFTKAIADSFIKGVPAIQAGFIKHPEVTPELLYIDMVKMKRYFKVRFEYKPEMITDTDGTTEPRYYISGKGFFGHYHPDNIKILNAAE